MGHGIRYVFNEKHFLFIQLLRILMRAMSVTVSHMRLRQHKLDTKQKTVLFSLQLMYRDTPPSGPHASFPRCHADPVTCHDMSQHALHHPQHGHRDNWHINHLSLISSSLYLWETRKLIKKVIYRKYFVQFLPFAVILWTKGSLMFCYKYYKYPS